MRSVIRVLLIVLTFVPSVSAIGAEIHDAAAEGDLASIERILELDPSSVNLGDRSGATPLHWAVDRERSEVVRLLLAQGADINARKNDGVSPLHVAAGLGRMEIADLLIAAGADINCRDRRSRTPLLLAQRRGYGEIVRLLLKHGAERTAAPAEPEKEYAANPVSYTRAEPLGIPVNVLTVNLSDRDIHISAAISSSGIGSSESFGSFVRRCKPTAAVNGTFFSKTDLRPIGDIVINGKLVHFGGMGTGLCVAEDNTVSFVEVARGRHMDWSAYRTVVCCGPRLLREGRAEVNAQAEGFRDPHFLGRGLRSAVGLTSANKLLLVNTGRACSLTELANVMKALGCIEAINLDGGASVGMYYRNRVISSPGRQLTNVLLIYDKS